MSISKKRINKKLFIAQKDSSFLFEQSKKSNDELFKCFDSRQSGLNFNQIEEKEKQFGYNTISSKNKTTWYKILFESFITLFTLILIVIAILNVLLPFLDNDQSQNDNSKWISFSIIISMVFLSGTLNFVQNFKSSKASEKLNQMINTTALVERNCIKKEIPIQNILPGDIIHLAAGDMVPADIRLLYSKDLFISQASLTGEFEPIEKTMDIIENQTNVLDINNICFMGTTVASGSAYGIAIRTGRNTFLGKISKSVEKKRPQTSFDKGIKKIGQIIIITMAIMCLIIFLIKGLRAQFLNSENAWISSLSFSLGAAIAIIPEMLPMIITLNLSKEAIKFSKNKAIIKNINAIQTFGAMNILCTDKTGTLTEDHIILQSHLNVEGKEDKLVLFYGCLNSYYQTGLKNLIDRAIIDYADNKYSLNKIVNDYSKIDEIPYDFTRRRMSIILKNIKSNEKKLITKGASEEILNLCSKIYINNKVCNLTDKWLIKIKKQISNLNENGMRVICVATNHQNLLKNEAFNDEDEKDLMLVGYIALLDPPKISARKTIEKLKEKGVEIKILTGDNEKVTKYICKEIGLKNPRVLLGEQIEKMSSDQLQQAAIDTTIFAKLSPEQKAIIIQALKCGKHVVGYMGDGINDAPAMREADIAISVDTAVDIAKESADVILLEKDLEILNHGCEYGRKTFINIMKYIKISLSSNFGNMLSILIAACWLPFDPLKAIQIIFMNLFYDITQLSIPWDIVDPKLLEKPLNWDATSIIKFMLILGPISTIFDVITFLTLWFACGYQTQQHEALFNTGWFIESTISQTIIIYVLRSKKISFFQTWPSKTVIFATTLSMVILISIPFIPNINFALQFIDKLDTHNLINRCYWIALPLIFIGYIVMSEFVKLIYTHKNNYQWL